MTESAKDADLFTLEKYSQPAGNGGLFCRGTAVRFADKGAVFLGQSAAGKSSLALQFMALGAELVSDDGIIVTKMNVLRRPDTAPHLIEARGIGLLNAEPAEEAPLSVVVDLTRPEADRLPRFRQTRSPGGLVPLLLGKDHPFLVAALCQYLKHGRRA